MDHSAHSLCPFLGDFNYTRAIHEGDLSTPCNTYVCQKAHNSIGVSESVANRNMSQASTFDLVHLLPSFTAICQKL